MKKTITLIMLVLGLFTSAHAQDVIVNQAREKYPVKITEVTPDEIKYRMNKHHMLSHEVFSIKKSDVYMYKFKTGHKIFVGNEPGGSDTYVDYNNNSNNNGSGNNDSRIINDNSNNSSNQNNSNNSNNSSNDNRAYSDKNNNNYDNGNNNNGNNGYNNGGDNNYNNNNNNNNGISLSERGKMDANLYYRKYKGATTGTFLVTFLTGPVFGLIPAIACSSTPPKEQNLFTPYPELMLQPDYRYAYENRAHHIKKGKTWVSYAIATACVIVTAVVIGAATSN